MVDLGSGFAHQTGNNRRYRVTANASAYLPDGRTVASVFADVPGGTCAGLEFTSANRVTYVVFVGDNSAVNIPCTQKPVSTGTSKGTVETLSLIHISIANARARRWFFANYPEGYTRTGALGKAWDVKMSVTVAGFSVSIANPAKAASYVYGTESYPQIPGHATTGWQPAEDTFTEIASAAETLLIKELDTFITEILR